MQPKKLYQILLHGKEWTNLKKGVELGDGRLEYIRRTGAVGIAGPGEWRPHPAHVAKSEFKFSPAKKRGLLVRFLDWF